MIPQSFEYFSARWMICGDRIPIELKIEDESVKEIKPTDVQCALLKG